MDESDLRNHLIQVYKRDCSTVPVSPLLGKDGDEIELLSIYHRPRIRRVHNLYDNAYFIQSYKKLFTNNDDETFKDGYVYGQSGVRKTNDDEFFRNIYVTGECGVGKTSFCQRMLYLWSKRGEHVGDEKVQKDVDFMLKFDFVFYVSLRDTVLVNVVDMIVDQYFSTKSDDTREEIVKLVENVILQNDCLILLDGLEEWSPERNQTDKCILPRQLSSDKCIYLTTCSLSKIESLQLSEENMDLKVKIKGLSSAKINCFVARLVDHFNDKVQRIEKPEGFIEDIKRCGLQKQLRIPIITEHLVALWLDHKLTDMPRAFIYATIVNTLFKNAEQRQIICPSAAVNVTQVPDTLAHLEYVKMYFSLLKKICLLSFRSYNKQSENALVHVFTEEELLSEPYFLSSEEIEFLFKVGILSRNKMIGEIGNHKQKLSLLHTSFLEFFAAMFVALLDLNDTFGNVVNTWNTIQDVVEHENFFRFLAGLSSRRTKLIIENINQMISDDLESHRNYSITHYFCNEEIKSLQSMIRKCFNEAVQSNDANTAFMLEDFIFGLNNDAYCSDDENESSDDDDDKSSGDDNDDNGSSDDDDDASSDGDSDDSFSDNVISKEDQLKQLLLLNKSGVKSIDSYDGKYIDVYDQLENLQSIHLRQLENSYISKFTDCMLKNVHTLQTVCITPTGYTLLPELPLRTLQHLTSISLHCVMMEHNVYSNLLDYLSNNIVLENIHLANVDCRFHDCTMTLNLSEHSKLNSLTLAEVDILCNNVKNCSLKYIKLWPNSESVVGCYPGIFNCIQDSELECLNIDGGFDYQLDDDTMKALALVKTLPYIKSLDLSHINLPDEVVLQIHQDVSKVKIVLDWVQMSSHCFHSFIESCVNNKSEKVVYFTECSIISFDAESRRELSREESVDYMSKFVSQIVSVKIICQVNTVLYIECNSKQ